MHDNIWDRRLPRNAFFSSNFKFLISKINFKYLFKYHFDQIII